MATLIVYKSKHGATEHAVNVLSKALQDKHITPIDLDSNDIPDLEHFDKIIIGGSIYMGQLHKEIKHFCKDHFRLLMKKPLGLFIVHGAEEDEKARQELTDNYPTELQDHAIALGLFGGEYNLEDMNFFEKFIVKKVGGITESQSNLKLQAIAEFADKLNNYQA